MSEQSMVRNEGFSMPGQNTFERLNMPDTIEVDNKKVFQMLEGKVFTTVLQEFEIASPEEIEIYENSNVELSEINGREVLIRTDIDYDEKDIFGRTNLERMEQGLAPLCEGKPIELHHIGQRMDSPLAELKVEEHRGAGNDSILHDKSIKSVIDRVEFNSEKIEHWKTRAEEIKYEQTMD
ncbi:HNH/ENDO VII family nuclease [Exiguobacterium sp. SH0S2]|uniref:HNH/ENDO VII family nuclease n=1 Tax=Exiguobacterium sp. SH0S2 TaxID=2510950 RepID=UPI00103C1F2A|nr:HNH/ENDO VII family nuclease [Exiguobacterium sp. SH0S2]TCI63150.1 nuclease [Exiguobacterium sp. SH0S2]